MTIGLRADPSLLAVSWIRW